MAIRRDVLKAKMDKLDAIGRGLHEKKSKLLKEGKSVVAVDKSLDANAKKRISCLASIIETKYRKMQKEEIKTKTLKTKPRGAMRKASKHTKTKKSVKKR